MVTYKLILDQRRIKSDGKYPVSIRVTYDRKTKYVYTGISVTEQQWDSQSSLIKKSCPGYKDLNKALTDKFLTIQKSILNLEEFETFSFDNLNQQINKPKKTCAEPITFLQFSNQIIQKLKDGNRTGNAIVYNTGVQRLINYVENENLRFDDIDYVLIVKAKFSIVGF